eukprot:scaffold22098_cov76-Cyclotella_meneghiniana.AAC.13
MVDALFLVDDDRNREDDHHLLSSVLLPFGGLVEVDWLEVACGGAWGRAGEGGGRCSLFSSLYLSLRELRLYL